MIILLEEKMEILKPYSNIQGFLKRYTLFKFGKVHIRIHKIIDKDRTNFYHNHPFNYISIILKGGYSERYFNVKDNTIKTSKHGFLSIIKRNTNTYHRIESTKNGATTLFITYGVYDWKIINLENDHSNNGLYERIVNTRKVWSKRENDIWFIGNESKEIAEKETRHSINQYTI